MCILVHAVKRQPFELTLEERISNALVEVGPSITLASLSEILAFAVGTFVPMPACRVFSMFAGVVFLPILLHCQEILVVSLIPVNCLLSFLFFPTSFSFGSVSGLHSSTVSICRAYRV